VCVCVCVRGGKGKGGACFIFRAALQNCVKAPHCILHYVSLLGCAWSVFALPAHMCVCMCVCVECGCITCSCVPITLCVCLCVCV